MHLTLVCEPKDRLFRKGAVVTGVSEGPECVYGYRVRFEWLAKVDCTLIDRDRGNLHIVDIESLPGGLDRIEELGQAHWPRTICLKRGPELVIISCTQIAIR